MPTNANNSCTGCSAGGSVLGGVTCTLCNGLSGNYVCAGCLANLNILSSGGQAYTCQSCNGQATAGGNVAGGQTGGGGGLGGNLLGGGLLGRRRRFA